MHGEVQYIPRDMHTVFALLCFVVVIHWLISPYPSGLLHWHCGNLTIAPVPAKQPWWIWINTSCEFIMDDCITTTKQSTTKPCAYFLGYTVDETAWTALWWKTSKSRRCHGIVILSTWWRHQIETFSALLALCAGNSPVPVNSPHKGQWRGALMFSLIWARINDWVNNREAGDLRRHRGHCDVNVMTCGLL